MDGQRYQHNVITTGAAAAVLLCGAAAMLAARLPSADSRAEADRTVALTYRFVVRDLPTEAARIAAYVPVPAANAHQRVLVEEVLSPYPYGALTETEYGNRFLRFDLSAAPRGNGSECMVAIRYRVTRKSYRAIGDERVVEADGAAQLARFLAPDKLVPIDGKVAEEARRVAGEQSEPLAQARRLYDHIVRTVRYDKSGQGWGRGDAVYACDVRRGNCTDFHSLFIAEARALGIPARFIMGLPLPGDASAGVIPGYHCWAEFYVAEVGWIPVDASEASKHPQKLETHFGGLDAHRIEFTIGRDIQLPLSETGPVNYSIYPHIEVDGAVHARVDTELSFHNLSRATGKDVYPGQRFD